jgi:hypothetical protein
LHLQCLLASAHGGRVGAKKAISGTFSALP